MNEKTYLLKEIELQYNYRLEDGVTYTKSKYLVNDLLKVLKGVLIVSLVVLNNLVSRK